MLERNEGQIINVASLIARIPTPFAALYTGSKFAVSGMSEALRHELRGSQVHVCVVYPSLVRTELVAGIKPPPFPPAVTPKQVAAAILKAVERKKGDVYVPRIGRLLALLPALLPDLILSWLSKVTGLSAIFYKVDRSARQSYTHRIASHNKSPENKA